MDMNDLANSIFWGLILQGTLLIIFGILLFMFPHLLQVLVGSFLIATGIAAIIWGFKTKSIAK